eukprot:scaffold435_cov174-Ochromonas_danica.AAC.2
MPKDLCLLCAQEYAAEGAIILFETDGAVLKLNTTEILDLRHYISRFPRLKSLHVHDKTYEVIDDDHWECPPTQAVTTADQLLADARVQQHHAHGVATTFFNTRVNVTNTDERILSYLISGLSMDTLRAYVRGEAGTSHPVTGLHPSITIKALNSFTNRWGQTPDAFQLAYPNPYGGSKGYFGPRPTTTSVGEWVQCDFFEPDYNELDAATTPELTTDHARRKKIPTLGGAKYGFLSVDKFSGYLWGLLVPSTQNTLLVLKPLRAHYELHGHRIQLLSADSAVLPRRMFRVLEPEAQSYLTEAGIHTRISEPYYHQNGTPDVERAVRVVKEATSKAIHYILHNPNFQYLGFTHRQIYMLWGELFHWALIVHNLAISKSDATKTRFEIFTGKRPDLLDIRILPIFAIVQVQRPPTAHQVANHSFYQRGLYVGPDLHIKGACRFAVLTPGNRIQIIATTHFKSQQPLIVLSDKDDNAPNNNNTVIITSDDIEPIVINTTTTPPPEEEEDTTAVVTDLPQSTNVLPTTDETLSDDPTTVMDSPALTTQKKTIPVPQAPNNDPKGKEKPMKAKRQSYEDRIQNILFSSRRPNRRILPDGPPQVDTAMYTTSASDGNFTFTDWSNHTNQSCYFSVNEASIIIFDPSNDLLKCEIGTSQPIECYRAVTENVPKSFQTALLDPIWGAAARAEWETIMAAKTLLKVDKKVAQDGIRDGADLVVMFPVYEPKVKAGQDVWKVRLVANGKHHHPEDSVFSPSPRREEFLIILHLAAIYDWDICHIDEVRAFLSASYKGSKPVFTKHTKGDEYFQVIGALYGLKSSPKDYNDDVKQRLHTMGFSAIAMSQCIFTKRITSSESLIVFVYVDDFVCTGASRSLIEEHFITPFRQLAKTTEPDWVLGMTIVRDRVNRTIKLTMEKRIQDLIKFLGSTDDPSITKDPKVPISPSSYKVYDEQFDEMKEEKSVYLNIKQRKQYLTIVGSLLWISGIRFDICFSTAYLSWFTQQPRVHHLQQANYVISYLSGSITTPLTLGGSDCSTINLTAYSDASLATGPKRRSITGVLVKLHPQSGAIMASTHATIGIRTSSFEAELDAATSAIKELYYVQSFLRLLQPNYQSPKPSPAMTLYCDNQAMIQYVQGQGASTGARYIDIRLWYTREKLSTQELAIQYMPGDILPADLLTKLSNAPRHRAFRQVLLNIMSSKDEEHISSNEGLVEEQANNLDSKSIISQVV